MNNKSETAKPEVSIVIPVMNEEESVPELAQEIEAAFAATEYIWECLWIDDGSSDRTVELIKSLPSQHHRLFQHDRNYGQSAAFYTGFKHARGAIIGTLDGDLQNDPADLPKMIAKLNRGEVDIVNGIRSKRQDDWVRRFSSRIANGFRNWITNDSITDVGCSIRVFYKEFVEILPLWKGMHRFLPTLMRMNGGKIMELPVNHRQRQFGITKYGIGNRLWVGLMDTFGVRWLAGRGVRPRTVEESEI
ncbi:glycosyltransferase family 2 protein [bacterium]|nr:glycosyltransferase family 2 protein [bacterium]